MIIKNARIALPGENELRKYDIRIEDEKIVEIARDLAGDKVFDAEGLWAFPGVIDPHVHFNDPGYTEREDFFSGTSEAASGGVTTIIDMPCTSIPPVTDLENLRIKLSGIKLKSIIDYGLFGGISAQSFSTLQRNISSLKNEVMGFKIYLTSSMESFSRVDSFKIRKILKAVKCAESILLVHAEDADFINSAEMYYKLQGELPVHYYKSRPETAELLAVQNILLINRDIRAQVHFVHISTAESVELIKKAEASCETAPHYLHFDVDDFARLGSSLKVAPSVKLPNNHLKLWKFLQKGMINFIASDHAPCPAESKKTGSIWTDYGGIPGVGTLFLFMLSEGYLKRKMPLSRLTELCSANAAKFYRFYDRKGSLEVGKDADIVLVSPKLHTQIKGEDFFSKGKITPFENVEFPLSIAYTFVRGNEVYNKKDGIIGTAGLGKFICPTV
ncbi:MAG: amidohydrolase family protein [Candidatus Cloacimonetes bacterium]|nr:amidohydrolase family protein [Candidatus Cloacimonadota bacterium]